MKLLELFKGTGSVGKAFKDLYPDGEVYSVDLMKKYNPTYCGDIMDFDYKQFPVGHFDIIWASPECKIYSLLQNTHIRKNGKWESKEHLQREREAHGKYSKRVIEIIEYLKPTYWFIENPWASAMKNLSHMKTLPFVRLDYCRFGYEYQKPTRIWTNKEKVKEMKCQCQERHKLRLGIRSQELMKHTKLIDTTNLNQRYSIPLNLIYYLLC